MATCLSLWGSIMSSISVSSDGRTRIRFFDGDGRERAIYIGDISQEQAEAIKVRITEINNANIVGLPMPVESRLWLNRVGDVFYTKLVAAGLVEPRGSSLLGEWLKQFIDGRSNLKPNALDKLKQTETRLITFFGANTPLRKITRAKASEWATWLRAGKYSNPDVMGPLSEASTRTHAGNAKTIMKEAVTRNLVSENVFSHLACGSTPTKNDRYVTPEEAAKILAECPNQTYRLIFGLARYAGLRTPSEVMPLRWADIDWKRHRLNVRSPKTERYRGHEWRVVPIEPRLMALLTAAKESPEDDECLFRITWGGGGAVHEKMKQIVKLSGVEPWEGLFQTLRRSCEIEWAGRYPQYAVSKWIGHSITVSGLHYANTVPDELYQKAAQIGQ